ncbi:MAG: PilC/PilY family type IV pilus protein, partial [Rhodoferax sp.]
ADGITFFMSDASTPATTAGGLGGSLGYSCSNTNGTYNGLQGGYLGVGVDEYGNFVNGAAMTQKTTTTVSTAITGTTYTGYIVTNKNGNTPTTNPPTWYNTSTKTTTTTLPTGSTGSPSTTTGSPTTTTSTVTNTVPNPTTATTTGATTSTTPTTVITGSVNNNGGSPKVYYAAGTYTTGVSTPTTTVATTYSWAMTMNDNTATTGTGTGTGQTGTNPGTSPGTISVRGAGNVNWAWLNKTYPTLYPGSMSSGAQQTAVHNTCATGYPYNSTGASQVVNGASGTLTVPNGQFYPTPVADYPLMASSVLPKTGTGAVTIYNQEANSTTNKTTPIRGSVVTGSAISGAIPITYALTITQNGLLNMSYSYNGGTAVPVITNQSISASNGTVPANVLFGFSAGTGGGSNVHEITCFKATQLQAASNSAGVNVQESARVETGTQLYLAYYHPTNWWGQLTATTLVYTAATDTVSLNSTANWDASCVLSGGTCAATGASNTAQPTGTGTASAGTRQLLTWSGTAGIPLQWTNLPTTQQGTLDANDTMPGSPNGDRLGYLRGDRSNEIGGSGSDVVFRTRNGVLGDIVNSSPTWVGAPSLPYTNLATDAVYHTAMTEGTSYATYASNNATRTDVVYVGANDGFLHAFRAGAYTASGVFDSTAPNDGLELLGYMPSAALATIHNTSPTLDFSSPSYSHAVFVDATPGTGDLYYNGSWHTWLVGGMGAGGNAGGPIGNTTSTTASGSIYALDITNPANFSEANVAVNPTSVVLGDWGAYNNPNGSTPITCVGNTPVNCGKNLGNTFGTPIIRRLHDGNWAAIFGNGLNSSTGTAGIYIMEVSSTGTISFRFLDTGYGPSKDPMSNGSNNGIAYVSSADLDGDHITDYVYAGDVFGNLWRFDLTSNNASVWAAGTAPLFSTPAGQPITTRVTVTSALSGSAPARVMIDFGTGQQLPQTLASAATYASSSQSIYGIWDWNMSAWNALGSVQYSKLTGPQVITTTKLQAQTAADVGGGSGNISGYRTVTQNPVCWIGSSTCTGGATKNTQFGWSLALPDSGEQIIYNPTTAYGLFIVNTTIPAVGQALSCDNQPPTGYTMAIAADTGGSPNISFFANATNNFVSASGAIVSGIGLSAVGTPSFVSAMTKPYMVNQTSTGIGSVTQVNAGANGIGARLNWIKLR